MAGNFFRGTTSEQDPRWGNSEKKLLDKLTKAGTFPAIYETKVQVSKVELTVINKWITERIIDLLGFEDDIVINMAINMLTEEKLDARKVHMSLVGFLEKKTQSFVEELWTLLVDAQSNPTGIPSVFLEKKKTEIAQRQQAGSGAGGHRVGDRVPDGGGDSARRSRWDDAKESDEQGMSGARREEGGRRRVDDAKRRHGRSRSHSGERHHRAKSDRHHRAGRSRSRSEDSRDRHRTDRRRVSHSPRPRSGSGDERHRKHRDRRSRVSSRSRSRDRDRDRNRDRGRRRSEDSRERRGGKHGRRERPRERSRSPSPDRSQSPSPNREKPAAEGSKAAFPEGGSTV